MRGETATLSLFLTLLLISCCYSLPLCTDSTSPITRNTTLAFCGYSGPTCCSATDDSNIQAQFTAMSINDSSCASTVKSILCAKCNPYSGELYTVDSTPRTSPILCNNSPRDFCATTWDTCKNVTFVNTPFSSITTPTKLSDHYNSAADFCMSAGGPVTDQTVCFNGISATFPQTHQPDASPEGICIEKLDNSSFAKLIPHPDGSNRIFLFTLAGKIFLAEVPNHGSQKTLKYNISQPFLDLTNRVDFDSDLGLQDVTFHPNFTQNGRFFVSYNCDSTKTPDCLGKCTCNNETGCDPSVIGIINGTSPCQYQEVVAEYTVGTSSPANATVAINTEVRRIITMGLPYRSQHAGELFFGPKDGYLYLTVGCGGNTTHGDPWNFAQKKKSLLGKILRLDVNNLPTSTEIATLGLWGNYTIPSDNPYSNDTESTPEIWALGFRNPWRCNYDSERSSYLFCGETGQNIVNNDNATFEKVSLVTKAGNYGWRVYAGFDLYNPTYTPGGSTPPESINPIFPILGYNHSVAHNPSFAAVVSGSVYRAKTDPCLSGRFLYSDILAFDMWAAAETPYMSGNFTTQKLDFTCSHTSPVPCDFVGSTTIPKLSFITALGHDNNKDMYYVTQMGVYRIVRSVFCGYQCNRS